MNITYLVGAGASCAIAPDRIPGMQMFACMKKFFPSDVERLKKLIVATGLFSDFLGSLMRSGSKFPKSIEKLNVELLLQELEEVATTGTQQQADAANETYNLIKSLITRLFSRLDHEGVTKTTNNPYVGVAAAIAADRHGHTHSFISFNYDIWLEQALQEYQLWNPANGYLNNQGNPMRIHYGDGRETLQVLPSSDPSPTVVLKPHGSLSWLTPHEDPYGIPVFLLDQVGLSEGGKYARGAPKYLPLEQDFIRLMLPADRKETAYSPLIIPPILNKAVGGEFLYKVHKSIQRLFEGAEAVVVIGWSMPTTDATIRQRIADGLAPRSETNNIKWLIVCNLGKTELFYNRYRATIPAKRSAICNIGFGPDFIKTVLQPLWDNQQEIPSITALTTAKAT